MPQQPPPVPSRDHQAGVCLAWGPPVPTAGLATASPGDALRRTSHKEALSAEPGRLLTARSTPTSTTNAGRHVPNTERHVQPQVPGRVPHHGDSFRIWCPASIVSGCGLGVGPLKATRVALMGRKVRESLL